MLHSRGRCAFGTRTAIRRLGHVRNFTFSFFARVCSRFMRCKKCIKCAETLASSNRVVFPRSHFFPLICKIRHFRLVCCRRAIGRRNGSAVLICCAPTLILLWRKGKLVRNHAIANWQHSLTTFNTHTCNGHISTKSRQHIELAAYMSISISLQKMCALLCLSVKIYLQPALLSWGFSRTHYFSCQFILKQHIRFQ